MNLNTSLPFCDRLAGFCISPFHTHTPWIFISEHLQSKSPAAAMVVKSEQPLSKYTVERQDKTL